MGWLDKIFGSNKVVQPVSLHDGNFHDEVMRSPLPVLVDVWSDGCAPCRQMEPIVMDLASRYEGRVKVAELHVQRAPKTLARLGVRSTPTILYFKKGQELERVVGVRSSVYHRQLIDEEILDPPAATANEKTASA